MWRFEVAIHNDADFCLRGENVHMYCMDNTLAHHIICDTEENARTQSLVWLMKLEVLNYLDEEYDDRSSDNAHHVWFRRELYEAAHALTNPEIYSYHIGGNNTIEWRLYELVI